MGYIQSSDDFFTYESRFASFRKAHPISRRRASNANLKGPKSLKWPHEFLSASDLAKSGFYYLPSLTSPDNVVCFLCHKPLDGWEETDDPLVEHLRHSPNCGWAITASVERSNGKWSEEHPLSTRLIEARKATFADKWPHREKKGWKCHIKQMTEAGWRYTPTLQSDDTVTCNYCALTSSNWEKNDNPSDKHHKNSPDCPFFTLINYCNSSSQIRKISPKRTRASWSSRLSIQSNLTACSTSSREASFSTEERDGVLTMGPTSSHKMTQERKRSQVQSRRLRLRKNEVVEATKHEEIVDKAQNLSQGRKRISEESQLAGDKSTGMPPKRRTARNRLSKVTDFVASGASASTQSTTKSRQNKASITHKGSLLKSTTPVYDSDIERELEADLNRSTSEDETSGNEHSRDVLNPNYSVNNTKIDDASEVEVFASKESIKPYPKLRVTRSISSSEKKNTHTEIDESKSCQTDNQSSRLNSAAELDHNISASHPSPPVAPTRKGRASTRKAVRKLPPRNTRSSVNSSNSHNSSMTVNCSAVEFAVEPQNSIEGRSNIHSTPTKSILSSKHSQNEGGERRCNEKNPNPNFKENVNASEITEMKLLTEESISCDEEHEQDHYIESDKTGKELHIANSMDFKDKSSLNTLVGNSQSKDITSNRRSNGKSLTNSPSKRNIQESTKIVSPEIDRSISYSPKSIMVSSKTSTPRRREATPQSSPPCSDAENKPPSLKHSISAKNITTPPATRRVVIIDSTPIRSSPSKRHFFVGLQSDQTWKAVDPETIFWRSPTSNSNTSDIANIKNANSDMIISGNPLEQAIQQGGLTSMEEKMTVEEWIYHNAIIAEESLKRECERMVSKFEREGTRAIRVLEGVRCEEQN
ncbi:putative at hook domain-containing protein [Erysiphe neolycopersici]|uniref:Putative at hook domain-containing protein n=1 Tax=Erysiphe neolycopersici TaxID=212602 RepID=A0A420HBM7_9PEZI|nr:putative at hook domain-containing protein [Erysiphe neolycopersici]